MKSIQVKIIDPIGLHARPASRIVNETKNYKSDIKIILDDREANAKSIINLMALGIKTNNKIKITAEGFDESEAITAVEKVMRDTKLIQ